MRPGLWLALAVVVSSLANADPVDPTVVWRPMYAFLGTWKGVRTGADRPVKLTRVYASAPSNQEIAITESGGGGTHATWGTVRFDAERPGLVLRQLAADASDADLALDSAASTAEKLVFASPESATARTRVTDERAGWNAFVERVERSAGGAPFAVVSETRFERRD
jgi:hypothetical protein